MALATEGDPEKSAYGDCVWTGECKGTKNKNLPQYVLAGLEVKGEGATEDRDRGWLREWGDMLALSCIIFCLLERATRLGVAIGTDLRAASHEIQRLMETRR